jgi:hypothetical protein
LRLISALAEGGDQLVAEEALALGIELMVPLPMAQAEYERDFAHADRSRASPSCSRRARVRELPLAPGNDAEAHPARGERATASTRSWACSCPRIARCCWRCGTAARARPPAAPRRWWSSTCATRCPASA